jgi:hypothetical protein
MWEMKWEECLNGGQSDEVKICICIALGWRSLVDLYSSFGVDMATQDTKTHILRINV